MAIDWCDLDEALACFRTTNMFEFLALRALRAQVTQAAPATAGTLSNVASSATSVQLLAANPDRKGVAIFNDSTQVLKIKYGTAASATSFTYEIPAAGTWNMPFPIYTGIIHGIWAAANGNARITELT